MIKVWWILLFLFPVLLVIYFYFPRFYQVVLRRRYHLPMGFTAEKFNYLFAPLLTIITICTTYAAFHVQTQFNDKQSKLQDMNRVEKIVFEFINMHASMVDGIRVTDRTSGNRSFHFIYYECMSLRHILDSMLREPQWRRLKARPRYESELTSIAFMSCYYGISQQKNGALETWVRKRYNGIYDYLLKGYIREVARLQRMNERRVYLTRAYENPVERERTMLAMKDSLRARTMMMNEYFTSDQVFLFADGHMPTLDSYMRLLSTTLKQFNKLLPAPPDRKDRDPYRADREYYLDLLRSQLSSHELLIVSLYAFTQSDLDEWFASGFLSSEMGCRNDLLKDVDRFLVEHRAGITDWRRYVSGNRRTLDSLQALRYVDRNPRVWKISSINYGARCGLYEKFSLLPANLFRERQQEKPRHRKPEDAAGDSAQASSRVDETR